MRFQLTATQISLVLAVFLPALVALVTKASASTHVKQLTLLALSTLGGWFASATSQTPYNLKEVLTSMGTTFLFSVASYFGLKSFVATPIEAKTGTKGIG